MKRFENLDRRLHCSAGVSFQAPPATRVAVTSLQAAVSIGNESVPACQRTCIPLILLCRRGNVGVGRVNRKKPEVSAIFGWCNSRLSLHTKAAGQFS
jgi:hypothetical protein